MLNRRNFLSSLAASLAFPFISKARGDKSRKPNVIFISIDDLNDWVSPLSSTEGHKLGYPGVITPNIQFLADHGTCFSSAYAPVPACSPSRTSVMLGVSADKTGIYYNGQYWQDAAIDNAKSIFGYVRENGWVTLGAGKLFHKGIEPSDFDSYTTKNARKSNDKSSNYYRLSKKWYFGAQQGERHWSNEIDRSNTQYAKTLIEQKFSGGGNFLGLGLIATHTPWVAPKKFYDLYPNKEIQLPPGFFPGSKTIRDNVQDLRDLPKRSKAMITGKRFAKKLDDPYIYREMIRSYLATISFTDHSLGIVLNTLKKKSELENTYLVIWSDHGMNMGEKLSFKKFTLWERALRVPFIMYGPGIKSQTITEPVSLIDIYPTLCTLLGLSIPSWCNGRDLSKTLLEGAPIKNPAAISIYSKGAKNIPNDNKLSVKIHSKKWNYIKHQNGTGELYNRKNDPHEWHNLYDTKKEYQPGSKLIQELEANMPAQHELTKPRFRKKID